MKHAARAQIGRDLTELDLCRWLAQAGPGDPLEYHCGFLAMDAANEDSNLSKTDRQRLRRLARRAMQLSEDGLVHLVQKRLGRNRFVYLVIARHRPRPSAVPLASLLEGSDQWT